MRTKITALLASALLLSGCATVRDSRVNPFNWFGNGSEAPVAPAENTNPLIPKQESGLFSRDNSAPLYTGTAVETVSSLQVERVPGGAIIRVTGIAAFPGAYDVRLTPATEDEAAVDGVLTYRLEARQGPVTPTAGGIAARELIVARKVTDQTLKGARSVRVEGASNAQVARR